MELREMLVIIGIVLIAVIIWDGIRRMRQRKASRYRGSYAKESEAVADPDELQRKAELSRELPNGGARIRTMTEEERAQLSSKLNLRERVPMLMDSVEVEPAPEAKTARSEAVPRAKQQSLDFDSPAESAPQAQASSPSSEPGNTAPKAEPPVRERKEPGVEMPVRESAEPVEPEKPVNHFDDEPSLGDLSFSAKDDDDFQPDYGDEHRFASLDEDDNDYTGQPLAQSEADRIETPESVKDEPETPPEPRSAASRSTEASDTGPDAASEEQYEEDTRPVEELVIMHVMAREGREIAGSELLELLLRAGLRFGPMEIFHYRNPKGQLEFSLANCVQPGTLNPDSMEQLTLPGVTLFMQLPQHADMLSSFDHLYEMAVFLAKQLDAVIVDEEHSTVTAQRVEHYRERLRNFARAQLIQAHE